MKRIISAKILGVTLGFVTILFLSVAYGQLKEVGELTSKIEVVRAEYKAAEGLDIRFTIKNETDRALNILKWATPLEGFNATIFRVTHDGKPVLYTGRVVKRAAPRPEEYVAIGPGQSVSVVVDLSRAYAIYDPGDYTVEFTSKVFDFGQRMPAELAAKKVFVPKLIRSNTVTIRVAEKRAELMPKPAAVGVEAKAPVFESCSQSQQTTLNTAHTNAQNYAMGSYLALVGTSVAKRANAKRYTTWFGTYDGTRYNTVASHFLKIFDAFSKQTVTFNCDCDENYYAYVYPSNPYKIYLCKVFWNAPATGTDSQFGTLIHEMSHFYVVASTDDHAYGQSSCKTLATNDPAKAIDNADSHEYFAENDPPLSMGLHLAAYSLMFIFGVALVYSFVYWLTRRGRAAAGWTE